MVSSPPTSLPSTPTRKAPNPLSAFSPRAPIQNASPRSHISTITKNTLLPTGLDLIVRGVGARKRNSDTVKLLQTAIESIQKDSPELADVPIVVKQFNSRGDWSTTAYIHLDMRSLPKAPLGSEIEPRADLLQCWKDALRHHDETWEVKWTPLTHGKDKRLWIRFAQLKEDPKDVNFQEKCRTHLLAWAKLRGYAVTNSYFNPGGVTLCLASPIDVEQILARGSLEKIPGIPFSVQPVRGRQVEIENAFELAITGLSDDYDQENLHDMLRDWLVDNFQADDITTLAGTRFDASEPEMFIFHMTTWKATCEVLADSVADRFRTDFKVFEMMQPPQLLHNLNTLGLGRKPGSARKDLAQGASMVTEGLDKLRREFNAYKESNSQLHQATQMQLASTVSSLTRLNNSVEGMESRLVSTQQAILFQARELFLTRAMTGVRSNSLSLRVNHMLETDETKKKDLTILLAACQKEEKRLEAELSQTSHEFASVVQGPSVGQLLSGNPPLPANSANEDEREHIKKRRLNGTNVSHETINTPPSLVQMQVDNTVSRNLSDETFQ